MEKTKLELVVGVFVFVGLLCLAYLSLKLGKLEMIGGDVYEVEAQFNSASGLRPGSTIEIAGVEVGRVRGITLIEDRAKVKLAVNNTVSQSVAHLHTHVVPRRRKDGLRGFFWPRQRYSDDDEMAALAARIRAAVRPRSA